MSIAKNYDGGPLAEDSRTENAITIGRNEAGDLFGGHTLMGEDPWTYEARNTELGRIIRERFKDAREDDTDLRWLYNLAHFNGRLRQAGLEFRRREEDERVNRQLADSQV